MKFQSRLLLFLLVIGLVHVQDGICQKNKKKRKMSTRKLVNTLMANMSELHALVEKLSQPVQIHVHAMNEGDYSCGRRPDHQDHHDHDHDDHDDHDKHDHDKHDHKGKIGKHDHHDHKDKRSKHEHHNHDRRGKKGKHHHHDNHDHDEDHKHKHNDAHEMAGKKDGKTSMETDDNDDDHAHDRSDRCGAYDKNEQCGTHVHLHFNIPGHGHGHKVRQSSAQQLQLKDEYTYAMCTMMANKEKGREGGYVALRQKPEQNLEVLVDLYGLGVTPTFRYDPNDDVHLRGLHVHQFADFSQRCVSFGGHFNPDNTTHGGHEDHFGHAGDWGNVRVDHNGKVKTRMEVRHTTLFGEETIIGRGLVIHEKMDDLGKGGDHASMTTGDAGGRMACCVIARMKDGSTFWK